MKIAFLGTPAFAVPSLQALIDAGHTLCVFSQPDRPAGRSGWEKTHSVCPASMSACSEGTANAGVPKKAIFMPIPPFAAPPRRARCAQPRPSACCAKPSGGSFRSLRNVSPSRWSSSCCTARANRPSAS